MKIPDKMLRLIAGSGSEREGACWMSALSYYAGESWSDHPECVPETIRVLAIRLNDMLGDGEREQMIGKHLFRPMGLSGSKEDELARLVLIVRAVMKWVNVRVRVSGPEDFEGAYLAARNAEVHGYPADPYWFASNAASAAKKFARDPAGKAPYSGRSAGHAVSSGVSLFPRGVTSKQFKRQLLALILRCCRVGRERREVIRGRGRLPACAEVTA